MADRRSEDFPLFPLRLVVLPGELVPLHIFEERYKTMIAECLEHERELGIVWLADDGVREIGCACAIERVLERMDDGRINLLVRGTRPFRVLERLEHLPYPAGVIELLQDAEDPASTPLAQAAHEVYAELVKRATDREPDRDQLAEMTAYAMAATVDLGPEAKQSLLELRSENARLRLLTRLLLGAIKRLELAGAQARAQSNGKVRPG
ncbi:MAG: LON peptidase substrate-binding domain-containing protein [Solirubrobacteraceae bacterium]